MVMVVMVVVMVVVVSKGRMSELGSPPFPFPFISPLSREKREVYRYPFYLFLPHEQWQKDPLRHHISWGLLLP